MTFGRWLLIGFPLFALGGLWLYVGVFVEREQPDICLMVTVGFFYSLIGLVAASSRPWCKTIARFAWYPLLLLVPFGTVWGIMALKSLRYDPEATRRFHENVKTLPHEEIASIIRRAAIREFGLKESQFGVSLAGGLRVQPGNVYHFTADLEAEYGFKLVNMVDPSTASVEDIINVINRKKT